MEYLTQLYYGNGKGKTSRAIGAAIRFMGRGGKVRLVQFLKDGESTEIYILSANKQLEYMCVEENFGFTWLMDPQDKIMAINAYRELLDSAFVDVKEGSMLILDELLDLITLDFIDEDYIINKINSIKGLAEIVITGHQASEKMKAICDYVSRIDSEKHPYERGIPARKGIEY